VRTCAAFQQVNAESIAATSGKYEVTKAPGERVTVEVGHAQVRPLLAA
jgi:hypothetical protein